MYLYIIYFQMFIHISVNVMLKNHYLHSSKNLKVLLKIQRHFVILLSLFLIRNYRGTCSPVEMLKGYMF